MQAREKIRKRIDELLALKTKDAWQNFLQKSADRRQVLYHYTTFEKLKSILESRQWWVGRTDCSNDPAEGKQYCLSFSRGLGTMAMWGNYSRPAGNGVRIRFNLQEIKNFKEFFLTPKIISRSRSCKDAAGTMYDVVYSHSSETNGNCLEFDGITLWGKSQPWSVDEEEWPCFLKSEIWRDENETRIVYCCDKTQSKYLKIDLNGFDFSKLTFELAPDFLLPGKKRPDEVTKNIIIESVFGRELLAECKISLNQFIFTYPNAYADLHNRKKNLFKASLKKLGMSKQTCFFNLSPQVFIRHADSESMLWNRRTSACVILQDAKPFLDAVTYEPQSIEVIIAKVAAAFETSPKEVADDVREFLDMLARETFVETDAPGETEIPESPAISFSRGGKPEEESWTPLGSFFETHKLPMELHIDLTNGCTERCIHCYIPDYTPHFLPLETVKKVLNEFREAGGLTIHFSGGECMMHPDFAEILRYAKSLHLNMLILSNLTLCDEKKVELLKEIDPQFVNVSLYSMAPAVHDSITTLPGSWQKTMKAILDLEKAGVHVRLAAPIMKNNQDSFDDLKKFAKEHHMHLITECDIFGKTDHDCSNQNCSLSPAELETALKRYKTLFYKGPATADSCLPDGKVCDIGKARIDVNAHGDYYPCDGCHGIVLGNASTHTFCEVWYGEKLNALRALCNKDFADCVKCENRKWCKVCPTRNFNETGDMFKHTPERCIAAAIKRKVFGE